MLPRLLVVTAFLGIAATVEYGWALLEGHYAVRPLRARAAVLGDLVLWYGAFAVIAALSRAAAGRWLRRTPAGQRVSTRASIGGTLAWVGTLLALGFGLDLVGRRWAHSPFAPEAQGLVVAVVLGALALGAAIFFIARAWPLPPIRRLLRLHGLIALALVGGTSLWPSRPRPPWPAHPPSAAPSGAPGFALSSAPNIVLVSIDTARADAFGFGSHGARITPHLDRLSREGARFSRAFAQDNWTLPSHASLFTSLYPPSHGVENLGSVLERRHPTLAELLRARGYRTGAFVDTDRDGFVGAARGFDHGFDDYLHYPDARNPAQIFLPARLWADVSIFFEAGHADGLVGSAIHWIDVGRARRGRDGRAGASGPGDGERGRRPFFLFLHLYDVHASWGSRWPLHRLPYTAHDPYYAQSTGAPPPARDHFVLEGRSGARYLAAVNRRLRAGTEREALVPDPALEQLRALYDSGVSYVDRQLGRLDAYLQASGLEENTIVVVTSDHGEAFLEHDEFLHEQEYHETLHVPLIWRFPPVIPEGRVISETAELVDIAPTLLRLAGLPAPAEFQGRDLLASMQRSDAALDVSDSTMSAPDRPAYHANRTDGIYGVRTRAFSYLLRRWGRAEADRYGSARREPPSDTTSGGRTRALAPDASGFREELYDLRLDPGELRNVRESRHELLAQARSLLLPFIATQESIARAGDGAAATPMSERTRELLRSLGYIDD